MIFEQNVNYDFQYLKFLKILVSEQNEYSIFILIVSIFFLKAIYQLIFFRFFLQLIYEIKVNLQKLAINSYLSTNLDYFNKIKQSTFTSKIHIETNLIADQGLLSFIKIFIEISTVTLLMSLILISDLFVVIFLLLFGIISIYTFKKFTTNISKKRGNIRKIYEAILIDSLKNMYNIFDQIKISNIEKIIKNDLYTKFYNHAKNIASFAYIQNASKIIFEFVLFFIIILIFIYQFKFSNNFDLVKISFVAIVMLRIAPCINKIINSIQNLDFVFKTTKEFYYLLTNKNEEIDKNKKKIEFEIDDIEELSLKNISYKFQNHENLIENFSFKFVSNKIYGLTGNSGRGKSTLAKLILGLIHINHGKFFINNNLINTKKIKLNKICTYIPQSIYLTSDTIKNNILFYRENIPSNNISKSFIEKFNLQFIDQFENGIFEQIGDGGLKLSGGQIQRIGISRGMIDPKKIIILDEAMNAIDRKTSINLFNSLNEFRKNRIIIIISHDKDLLNMCDEVINL